MDEKQLYILIDKYLRNTASEDEVRQLMVWYNSQIQNEVIWESNSADEEISVKQRIEDKINARLRNKSVYSRDNLKKWSKIAVVLFIVGVAAALLEHNFNSKDRYEPSSQAIVNIHGNANAKENRFVLLPDSSKVVLRPGSSLKYANGFKGKTREVTLIGEGYFDIHRNVNKPFIVHAGDVNTVVLGTAFTVKAIPGDGDVEVTVQHGKVRVEKQRILLAELIANQQLDINVSTGKAEQKYVIAEETLSWTAEDLKFDSKSFGELVKLLSRRYHVSITFKNGNLANCPVTGTFKGTETLDEVLTTLCTVRNANFSRQADGTIVIDGVGC